MSTLFDFISIAIGLVFVYWLLSIITSFALELISTSFGLRARNLANAIHLMLDPSSDKLGGKKNIKETWVDGQPIWDKSSSQAAGTSYSGFVAKKVNENPVKAFYSHPMVATLSKPKTLPSYINPSTFSAVMADLFSKAGAEEAKSPEEFLDSIKAGIQQLEDHALKGAIIPIMENAERMETDGVKRIQLFKAGLEDWFTATMDRCSGWYKRSTTLITIILGILIAFVINADSIGIAKALWRDGVLRQSIATAASPIIQNALTSQQTNAEQALTNLSSLNIPIGWSGHFASIDPGIIPNPQDFPVNGGEILAKLIGIIITGLAISQGSSIWFDALQKLINLRSSGAKPDRPS